MIGGGGWGNGLSEVIICRLRFSLRPDDDGGDVRKGGRGGKEGKKEEKKEDKG